MPIEKFKVFIVHPNLKQCSSKWVIDGHNKIAILFRKKCLEEN